MINPRAIVTALTFAVALLAAPTADAIERHATPSNLTSVFSNAQANDTIRLASGNYGTFRGGIKSGMVTLAPEPRAHPTMELDFNPAANITISRVTVTGGRDHRRQYAPHHDPQLECARPDLARHA